MIGPMPEPADVDQELAHPSNPPSLVTRFFSSWLAQPVGGFSGWVADGTACAHGLSECH